MKNASLIIKNHLQAANPPRPYAQPAYNMANGAAGIPAVPPPGAAPLLPNQGRIVQAGPVRVLCIADVRGSSLHTPSPFDEIFLEPV